MWEIVAKGGIMMIPLGFCSIVALAVIIERVINLRRSKIIHQEFVDLIENINKPEDINETLTFCRYNNGAFVNIIRTGLENFIISREAFREAIADQGRQEMPNLEKGLIVLEVIAGIAPFLGLLGTVIGMIHVFQLIAVEGSGGTKYLSGGIAEALVATASGLLIAIVSLIFYHIFQKKAESIGLEIEKHSNKMLTKLQKFQTVDIKILK